jgi:multiple sugar transport system permease protein
VRAGAALRVGPLALGGAAMALPFIDMLLGALRTPAERLAQPPAYWPRDPQWGNFARVLSETPILAWTANSLIVTGAILVIQLMTSAAAGYALAKIPFRGRSLVLNFVLIAHIFPFFLLVVPTFFLLRAAPLLGGNDFLGTGGMGLLDSYAALILPFVVSWYGVFYMRQALLGLPDEVLDAARIDGANELQLFFRIVLPMARPALWTLGLFIFAYHWNEVIWTMTVTRTAPGLQTLPVGIHLLRGEFSDERAKSLQQAMIALSLLPTLLIYVVSWKALNARGRGLVA